MTATPAARTESDFHSGEMSSKRIRLGLLAALMAVGVVLMVVYLALALTWRGQPFMGVTVNHTMTVNASSPNGSTAWTGREAGLKAGDQITAINGLSVANNRSMALGSESYNAILRDFSVGDTVEVAFRYDTNLMTTPRADGVACAEPDAEGMAACSVSFALMSMPDADFFAFFVVPFASGVIVLMIAGGLVYLRPFLEHTFIVAVTLILLALGMGGIFDSATSHQLTPVWLLSMIGTGTAFITMGLILPRSIRPVVRQPYLRFIPPIFGALLVLYVIDLYNTEAPVASPVSFQVSVASAIVGLAIMAALVGFYHRRVAPSRTSRDQANIIMMGALLGLAPGIFWIAGRFFPTESPLMLSIEASLPFLIVPSLSLVYAVLQVRRFDTDEAVNRGITYFILFTALGIGYGLLVLGASLLATDTIDADNPLLIVLTIFLISALFVPVRTNLQRRIDSIYYRVRHDYQSKLERFNQQVTSLASVNVLIKEFRQLLDDTIQPFNTLIFLRSNQTGGYVAYGDPVPETDIVFSDSSGVINLLGNSDDLVYLEPNQAWPPELHIDKTRLGVIKVMVIAGLPGDAVLNGFVAIGPPRGREVGYNYEELRFIRGLVGSLSIAIERAAVIETLERSVKELEVMSYVSQAANFTIETEDLMELLSAQTARLTGSPYFYIVLKDTSTDQLYYAFFQEDDDRRTDLEGRRWLMGDDLYSEVIQSGQPLRVDSYRYALDRRGYKISLEAPDTQAWLGVPLVTGGRTLGALVVAERNPERRYSPDQQRTMNDLSALAASALDKSRLFSEVNARARQLAALNEISQQLVATEGDFDRLLEVITTSAVEILNAEAGSLLLTVEDGTDELEFKVATGNTGQQLIGKRLARGHGLVGRVAQSGEPIISNDTTADQNWEGDIAQDFRTQSVLAVPLIAQDRVIGVLEMINKLDGSIYVEEDVRLLTTFAGQAAIAFENARLFQQTDLQLSQRVLELEALERIDRELNRSLDLDSVAEITVRWAIENSNAAAGLLGVPDEEAGFMQIVATQGYTEADAPPGAEGDMWPMDRGIVRRVLRTRRADLQPYVDMDPDYVPSLRGALSQITIPMIAGNNISAILILETDREPRLNLLDQDWAQRLAEHASIAIENAKLYAEITQANETKSEFIGFAAHELKNPLTSVRGYASSLGGSMAASLSPDQIKQFAAIIQNNAERMDSIISDLRDIARDDAGKLSISLEPVSLRQVMIDTLLSLQKQIESKGQTVVNDVTEDLPPVLGDRSRLTQIMVNFLSNAHKYSPEDTTIRLEADVLPRYVTRNGRNLGDVMHVRISDEGIGMSPETVSKLFTEDYFRSDNKQARAQEGTGLGMIITKRLIEGHGGDVWIESELGSGSTFHFVIPLASNKRATQENEKANADSAD